jgi:hypothetical protein
MLHMVVWSSDLPFRFRYLIGVSPYDKDKRAVFHRQA